MNKVRVAVNGYGVIGKRVADAVALQEDMALAGVADVVHDYRLQVAAQHASIVRLQRSPRSTRGRTTLPV